MRIAREMILFWSLFFVLCVTLGFSSSSHAMPAQDITILGQATFDGTTLTQADTNYIIKGEVYNASLTTLYTTVTYQMGDRATDNYVLAIPMDTDPAITNKGHLGDKVRIYINDKEALESPVALDVGYGEIKNQNITAVSHGAPAKFVILDPADTDVDAGATVTIQLQDAEGNVCSGVATVAVTVAVDKGTIDEAQPITLTNGVGTVHISYHSVGTVNISLVDSEGTGYDVTSTQDVAFSHGAAKKIALSANPETISSSTVCESVLTATIQDQYGNTVTSGGDSTLAVTFAVTDTTYGDIKTGETNPATAVNGVASIVIVSKVDATGGNIPCTADATGSQGALTQGSVTVRTVPFGIVPAGPISMKVSESESFHVTGGTAPYEWTVTGGGSLAKSTTTTAADENVYTAPSSPASVTVSVSDSSTPALTAHVNINVYEDVTVTNKPTETPLIQAGESSDTFSVEGGDGSYTWSVVGPVSVAGGTGASYAFTAPTTGAFAGVYTVTVADGQGWTDSFNVKVPMKFEGKYALLEGYPDQTWHLKGAPANTSYTWTVTGDKDYGSIELADNSTWDATFTYDVPDDIAARKSFTVTFIADDPDLKAAGLEELTTPTITVYPLKKLAGYINGSDTKVGIPGATVRLTAPASYAAETTTLGDPDAGYFSFSVPDTGADYHFLATAPGYVARSFKSTELADADPTRNIITLTAAAEGAYITGTVTPVGAADVTAIYEKADGTLAKDGEVIKSASDGTFRFDFAADHSPYTLTATRAGFAGETAVSGPLPVTNVTVTMTALSKNEINALAGGSSDLTTVAGQAVSIVQIPFDSVEPAIGNTVSVSVTYTPNVTSDYTEGSGEQLYVVEITGTIKSGKYILITLPFDLSVVKYGDFENERYVIYHAPTKDDLINGTNLKTVSKTAIMSVDYVGDGTTGLVTFKVSSLSVFGVGTPPAAAAAEGGGGVSGCFINTAGHGSVFDGPAGVVGRFGEWFRSILR